MGLLHFHACAYARAAGAGSEEAEIDQRHSEDPTVALSEQTTRAIMAIKVNEIMQAASGVRADLVLALAEMLEKRVTPLLPAHSDSEAQQRALVGALAGQGSAWYKVHYVHYSLGP